MDRLGDHHHRAAPRSCRALSPLRAEGPRAAANAAAPRLIVRRNAEMIGELAAVEARAVALRIERKHGCVPIGPDFLKIGKKLRLAGFQVRALERVVLDIEQKAVAVDLQILPGSATTGPLRMFLI